MALDFRCLDEGFGGQKNKRKLSHPDGPESIVYDHQPNADSLPPSKRPALEDPEKPAFGRKWKQVRPQRASAARVSLRCPSLEQRTQDKELKRAFRERKAELKEEIRQNKVDKRKRREEREKRRQENILRSGTKLQKVTNPKTLKKIAKSKQRKQLKVVPDDLLTRKSGAENKEE